MKVIVCGAGQVGFNIARYLAAEEIDVTVIDTSDELVRRVSDVLDVRAMQGNAPYPDVLERAGAADCDILIAVTHADEVNMVACQAAHSLFNVPVKIARIRAQNYLKPEWANLFNRNNLPIDLVISPEIEVARAILRRLQVPGAFDSVSLSDGLVRIIGVRCNQDCPVVNTPLRQLTEIFPFLNIIVIGIIRDGKGFVPTADDPMLVGDEVYFSADASHVPRAMAVFGHEEPLARRLIVAGGGHIGLFFAQEIERSHPGMQVKIIESNKARAEQIVPLLPNTAVLHGSLLDPEILDEAGVGRTEAIIAVTNDDETNILGSLLAKRHGCRQAFTLINNMNYAPLVSTLGIDAVVSPRAITVSSILQYVRRGRIRAAYSLREDLGEVMEIEALETSNMVGNRIADADFPEGIHIGAIVREGRVIIPRGDTTIRAKDRVILFAKFESVREAEKLFAAGLEFF